MRSRRAALLGEQRPRLEHVPEHVGSDGKAAAELARAAGLVLDPWQERVLAGTLAYRADDKWAALECGLICPRQNGKGTILEARELAGLYLPELGEKLLLHTAHEFKTAQEAFLRIKALIDGTDEFRRQVTRVRTSHGEEGIELKGGRRLRFLARSKGSGRGFTGDLVVMDEAMFLTPRMMEALVPTLSARPNPQIWYTASAGEETSLVLAGIRARGIAGSEQMAYFEWSVDEQADPNDRRTWAKANPGLGIRLTEEFIEREQHILGPAGFARERLGIWPQQMADRVIPELAWLACCDPHMEVGREHVRFGLDAQLDPQRASIAAVAGGRGELVEAEDGLGWVVDRAEELARRYRAPIFIDGNGPAVFLGEALEQRRVKVRKMSNPEVYAACAGILAAIGEQRVKIRSDPRLDAAAAAAEKKMVAGDRFVWRRGVQDATPLVALTLAFREGERPGHIRAVNLADIPDEEE